MKLSAPHRSRRFAAGTAFVLAGLALSLTAAPAANDVIRIVDWPSTKIDPARHDGGLPLVRGAENVAVFRASRLRPDLTDGKGYTYNHHPDLAAWRGRLYVAWDSGEKDEDTWPSHQVYSTSVNGRDWSAPTELFPQGISTPLRLYFFHAPNDRMLAFAGLRLSHAKTDEAKKGPLVVREICADHTLGPVFTLRSPAAGPRGDDPSSFTTADDPAFITACRALLAAHPTLETQDYGLLLEPAARSPWHDAAHWPDGKLGNGFWKAPSFFHRADGALVGIGKNGWTSTSTDDGLTWSQPVVPPTLVTNNAKVWGQRTGDGRYALVYNPQSRPRFPLAIATGDDGITFRELHAVQEDFPAQRYAGLNKNIGLQYVRGISEWASDGSWPDVARALWLVYSANKEDLWVSRVPLATNARDPALWNLYIPKWSKVTAAPDGHAVEIENREPGDFAGAAHLFPPAPHLSLHLTLTAQQFGRGALDLELSGGAGGAPAVRLRATPDGSLSIAGTPNSPRIATLTRDRATALVIEADSARRKFSISIDGTRKVTDADFAEPTTALARVSIRVWDRAEAKLSVPVPPELDQPTEPTAYHVRDVKIEIPR